MSHIIHRSFRHIPRIAHRSEGIFIEDKQGKKYMDASGGAAVSCVGHSHPDVIAAMETQIRQLAYAHTGFFSSEVAETLADGLAADAPGDLNNVYFVSGGSEAMEAAIKMARQYFVDIGQPNRTTFIGRRQSYHGNTLGALAVGGNEWRRKQFSPLLMDTGRVSPCYEYRDKKPTETQSQYTERLLRELEQTIESIGPGNVIGFCAETVVGATAGAVPPTPGYFRGVREICDEYGILLILDEVMCGMGRTGKLFAFEQDGVVPDLVAIAKGLGGGYQPIGALIVRDLLIDEMRARSDLFQHGHTYLGHPTACAAALAVQRVIKRDNLLENVNAQGQYLMQQLKLRFGEHEHIGDIRGRGLFLALEIVRDRETKTAFDPSIKIHSRIKELAMEHGLMVYPMGGTIDGRNGDHILIAPPFIVTSAQVDEIVDRLALAVKQVLTECVAQA